MANGVDGEAFYNVVQDSDMEGIICKDLNRSYAIDGKDDRWIKVKNYGDVIAVIGGFTLNGGLDSTTVKESFGI